MNEITIPIKNEEIKGFLEIPKNSQCLVIFVHGSGSSRFSKRNQDVASVLNQAGISTLLFDLLTPSEERIDEYTREFRFDISMLAKRLEVVTELILDNSILTTSFSKIGYFGASTGAAAALIAAANLNNPSHPNSNNSGHPEPVEGSVNISAVVSRGGRPDLAQGYLEKVTAPTLLIVGSLDTQVIELNQLAFDQLKCTKELKIIPGATHLFEEPGKLEEVAGISAKWFNNTFYPNIATVYPPDTYR